MCCPTRSDLNGWVTKINEIWQFTQMSLGNKVAGVVTVSSLDVQKEKKQKRHCEVGLEANSRSWDICDNYRTYIWQNKWFVQKVKYLFPTQQETRRQNRCFREERHILAQSNIFCYPDSLLYFYFCVFVFVYLLRHILVQSNILCYPALLFLQSPRSQFS